MWANPFAWNNVTKSSALTREELSHYQRQLSLNEVGIEGQLKLKGASVLIVGAGGLGSPLALYLAAVGIGRLGLIDDDVVNQSNLHRQVIYDSHLIGEVKVAAARKKLQALNPHVSIETYAERLTIENAQKVIENFDVVADGTDNFPTRYLINDVCVRNKIPNVYGSIYRFEGQVAVFCHADGPCYRCLYPKPPPPGLVPSCTEAGVLGILPGIVGTLQGAEVIKLVLGIGKPLSGRMLLVDTLGSGFQTLTVRRSPICPACSDDTSSIEHIGDYEDFCGLKEPLAMDVTAISPTELKRLRDNNTSHILLDVRHPFEAEIATIGADLHIPLPELMHRLEEIDPQGQEPVIVYCRSGGRSEKAVRLLTGAGYSNVLNLQGGILGWSHEVDPSIAKY